MATVISKNLYYDNNPEFWNLVFIIKRFSSISWRAIYVIVTNFDDFYKKFLLF